MSQKLRLGVLLGIFVLVTLIGVIWTVYQSGELQPEAALLDRGTIKGQVSLSTGGYASGALIEVDGDGIYRTTTANSKGFYRFDNLPAGIYALFGSLSQCYNIITEIKLSPGQTVIKDFVLKCKEVTPSPSPSPSPPLKPTLPQP